MGSWIKCYLWILIKIFTVPIIDFPNEYAIGVIVIAKQRRSIIVLKQSSHDNFFTVFIKFVKQVMKLLVFDFIK